MMFIALTLLLAVGTQAGDLVQTLQQNGDTTLISLVQQAGLVNDLGSGTFTIFAPSNAAFAKLPSSTLTSLSHDKTALANLLKYHVVAGAVQKSDVSNELQLTTLAGTKIRFNIYSHTHAITVEGTNITNFDLKADNGFVHEIDSVLTPPQGSIVDILAGHSELSTVYNYVKSVNFDTTYLQGDNYTFFAPTNAAYHKLLPWVGQEYSKNHPYLLGALKYYVVPHTVYTAGMYKGGNVTPITSYYEPIEFYIYNSQFHVDRAAITTKDISATNGVVHITNEVLIGTPVNFHQIWG